jgi:hypothetical protein
MTALDVQGGEEILMEFEPDCVARVDPDPGHPRTVSSVNPVEGSGEAVGISVETIKDV